MVPVTTGHFFACDACFCITSANSAITAPNAPKATPRRRLGSGIRVETNSLIWCSPNAEPNTMASMIAVPMPRQPHRPFGRSRSSTASFGCSGL